MTDWREFETFKAQFFIQNFSKIASKCLRFSWYWPNFAMYVNSNWLMTPLSTIVGWSLILLDTGNLPRGYQVLFWKFHAVKNNVAAVWKLFPKISCFRGELLNKVPLVASGGLFIAFLDVSRTLPIKFFQINFFWGVGGGADPPIVRGGPRSLFAWI